MASPPSLRRSTSMISSTSPPSKSASTACAASRPGRWSSPGTVTPSRNCWTVSSLAPAQVRRLYDSARSQAHAEPKHGRPPLALRRRPADGRGDASAHDARIRNLWQRAPPQDGAPVRLVVPWKYGFKGIKSIVKISLVENAAPNDLERIRARRVRLLRQRQSPRRSSPLEPGHRAAASTTARTGKTRSCSTATPTRSVISIQEWICARTSDRP